MSSAITVIGDRHVIPLASRLVVAIRLQGTIGYIDPAKPFLVKPRPYTTYLAETLRRLQCAVILLVPTNPEHDQAMMDLFYRRDFPVPFRYLHDHSKFVGIGANRGNRKRGVAPNNYTEYLRRAANEMNGTGQATDRIFFIDSEVNYRFTPVQTLVLDAYEPMSPRQKRALAQARHSNPFGDASSRQARRHSAAMAKATGTTVKHRATTEAQHWKDAIEKQQHYADFLVAQQAYAVQPTDADDVLRPAGEPRDTPPGSSRRPLKQDSFRRPDRTHTTEDTPPLSPASTASSGASLSESNGATETNLMSTPPAINLEDYSLVAVAEMIAEMSATDAISVAEYLKTEPLVEKVAVPFHGTAYYLDPENCDNIDLLNWDAIEVLETKARDSGVPESVPETDDMKDFFQ